ncbi:cyclic nucleotide-binding domain-containing protein [bacterium]|nr:cyclic nucleotide-binding domain-containing protein [bacterium]
MTTQNISHELLTIHPYSELTDELKQQALAHVAVKEYSKGALIFQRGRPSSFLHYLVEGSVDLIDANFDSETINAVDRHFFLDTQVAPNTKSAVAKTPVTMLAVERDYLDLLMMWNSQAKANQPAPTFDNDSDWMSGLIDSPLLGNIPPAHLQQLFSRFELIEAKKGVPVIRQGELGEFFYVVRQGQVNVSAVHCSVDVMLNEGEFFGEESLIADTPRNATVTPVEDGWLMRLSKKDFKSLLEEPVINYMSYRELIDYAASDQTLQILDVRLSVEYKHHHLPGSLNIPLQKLRGRVSHLSQNCLYLITSDAGRRAEVAAHLLCQAGLQSVILRDVEAHYITPRDRQKPLNNDTKLLSTMAG